MKEFAFPKMIYGEDLKIFRNKMQLTQVELAEFAGVSKSTIERWEASSEPITGPIVPLLKLLNENLQFVDQMKIPKMEYRLRLWYMFKEELCTIIDVDTLHKIVKIKNFTKFEQHTAFGRNYYPSYEDYEEFLESRCFPRTRDKMKIQLEALDLPFYDPFMIIEKTQGRMAEDDFWIKIEKK